MESPARNLSRGLAEHAEAVCKHYLSNGRRCGNYWIVGDVNNHAGRSLYVRLKGPLSGKGARGKWTDAATGENGDLLDLIAARKVSVRSGIRSTRRGAFCKRRAVCRRSDKTSDRPSATRSRWRGKSGRHRSQSQADRPRPICALEKSRPISILRPCAITRRYSIASILACLREDCRRWSQPLLIIAARSPACIALSSTQLAKIKRAFRRRAFARRHSWARRAVRKNR